MKRNSSTNTRTHALGRAGFTLVELLIVIAILAILAGIGAVGYTGYIEYTKKGLDKQTVGEINHALELANYSDPSLFDGATTVYLADNGIICADPGVAKALEDAFGDLSGTKLSYLKWESALPAGQLNSIASSLGLDGSMVDKYWDNGYSASFAGNIEELWDDVYSMIDLYGGITGDSTNLSKLVNGLTDTTNKYNSLTYREVMLNAWKSPIDDSKFKDFEDMCSDGTFQSNVGTHGILLSMAVARSCAFKAYAEKLDLSAEARAELEAWNPVPTKKIEAENVHNAYAHYDAYFPLNSVVQSEWSSIIEEYQTSGQAEADATAFLGMLEAGRAVEDDLLAQDKSITSITDKDYYDALTGYVGITETIMESRDNWNAIQASMADSQRALYATVTSKDGRLNIDWHGKELDEFDVTSDAGAAGGTEVCNLAHTDSITGDFTKKDGKVILTLDKSSLSLCTKGGPSICTVRFISSDGQGATRFGKAKVEEIVSGDNCVTITGSGTDWKIEATNPGHAQLKFYSGDIVQTISIEVH